MIKLKDLLPNKFKKDKEEVLTKDQVINSNTWTHATWNPKLINHLLGGKDFIGNKEDLKDFNVPQKGPFATFVNRNAPNFLKGDIFHGFEANSYLITTDLDDEAFQPNWNGRNYDNFKDSANVGVLKPEYRDAKNFKLWKRVPMKDKEGRDAKYGYIPITKPVEQD